jgi:hypothetical protein
LVLANLVPRPEFGNVDSYLANGNGVTGQLAWNKGAQGSYLEAQAGVPLYHNDSIDVRAGAGLKVDDGKLYGASEVYALLRTKPLTMSLTGRFSQRTTHGVDTTVTAGGKYAFW